MKLFEDRVHVPRDWTLAEGVELWQICDTLGLSIDSGSCRPVTGGEAGGLKPPPPQKCLDLN